MLQASFVIGAMLLVCNGTVRSAAWVRNTARRASSHLMARAFDSETTKIVDDHDRKFIRPLERTVSSILAQYDPEVDILSLPASCRESVGVARHLHQRLRAFRTAGDCPRCWLQRAHCICPTVKPLPHCPVRRLFVLVHHKEICLQIDTAKLILAAFPEAARLVVAGLGPEYQPSMQEYQDAMKCPGSSVVLFPADESVPWTEHQLCSSSTDLSDLDVVIMDGTWEQARKMHRRYIVPNTSHVQLREDVLSGLSDSSKQLRRHPEHWREISTLAATRLLLEDMDPSYRWSVLSDFQVLGDAAAQRQLGPKRLRQTLLLG